MKNLSRTIRAQPWFEAVYKVGVAIKGFDGLVELIVGVSLLISPSLVHTILSAIAGEASQHNARVFHFIAQNVARIDTDLGRSGLTFLIIFLIGHGVVKLALVYCLLKEIVRAYPVALAILVVFLIYQAGVLILQPSIGVALFTLLDIIIIWLVWGEYQELRAKK